MMTLQHYQAPTICRAALRATLFATLALSGLLGRAADQTPGERQLTMPWTWTRLPALPNSPGVAGAFAGVHNGALIVGGGANFPDGMPWEGGVKVWHDAVFALDNPDATWQAVENLPGPRGYGVSVSTPRGIACLGGSDGTQHTAACFLLRWEQGKLVTSKLPDLPKPCANMCGALLGNVIYVAGGSESPTATTAMKAFWSLDSSNPNAAWTELPPWPGPARILAVAGVQEGSFFLFSGAALHADEQGAPARRYLADAYRYAPADGWRRLADLPRAAVAAPSPAPAIGQAHLVILGGDDGSQVKDPPAKHRGFSRQALAYHTITDTWTAVDDLPFAQVTTPAVEWRDQLVIPAGEIAPGVRTTQVWRGRVAARRTNFGLINVLTLLSYPLGMLAIGWFCSRRNKSSADYFKASGRIPWWAAGLSIYATMLSSLTFMAVPAKAYASDWNFALTYVTMLLLAPVIIALYIPFFRGLNVTTAYEYLEHRFNLAIRLFGSASFIAFQIARTGIVLYLPALALSTVSDVNMQWCIIGMTLLTMLLTVYGGMETVVWTDVAQTGILLGAVIVTLIVLSWNVDGGLMGIIQTAHAHGKFVENINWSGDLTLATGWVALVGLGFNNFISYTSNQEVVQRYLTTADSRRAGRAIWTNALISIPSGVLFFGVGTALFAFYRQHPSRLDPTIQNDAIFPLFMLRELPVGVAGFVVAGIFAAAQPTSGLNSTAAAFVTDFYQRLKPNVTDREALRAGRIATVVTGLLGMSVALIATTLDITSIWEIFLNMLGLTTGALAGVFALGIFTRRANSLGATLGLIAGIATIAAGIITSAIHPLLFGALGVVATFTFGYLFSLPFSPPSVEAVTVHRQVVAAGPT